MNLPDALHAIADQLGIDADALVNYADADTVGGFHADAAQSQWAVGSIWDVEGKVLYALTRALKPAHVAEFGVNAGCSTTHFLTALDTNGSGTLDSVDPWEGAGGNVPDTLRKRWKVHHALGTEWLAAQPDGHFDLLFEDMVHGAEATREWWLVAQQKVASGGVIISHDAAHPTVGDEVRRGISESGVTATVHSIEPSDCGLAIWQAPGKQQTIQDSTRHPYDRAVLALDYPELPPEPEKKPAPRKPAPARKPTTTRKPTAVKK